MVWPFKKKHSIPPDYIGGKTRDEAMELLRKAAKETEQGAKEDMLALKEEHHLASQLLSMSATLNMRITELYENPTTTNVGFVKGAIDATEILVDQIRKKDVKIEHMLHHLEISLKHGKKLLKKLS